MKILVLTMLTVSTALLSGCASTEASGRTAWGKPTVYAGTKLNTAALNEDYAMLSIYKQYGVEAPPNPMIDAPLSFAFDTVMLPMDAWYWANSKIGLGRPSWSGMVAWDLRQRADSTSKIEDE